MRSRRFLRLNTFAVLLLCCLAIDARSQSPSPTTKATESDIAKLSDGTVSGNMYHNPDLGFRYEFPAGWNVSDKTTQARAISDGQQFVWADDMSAKLKSNVAHQCSKGLLFVSRYPDEMRMTRFNPLALLIAADPACLPGTSFPSNVKDRDAIQKIVGNLGIYFKVSNTNSARATRIRAFDNAGRVMLEVSQPFYVSSYQPGTTTFQRIRSSIWILKDENYWLMLLFASDDDAQLDKLRATRVFFDSGSEPSQKIPTPHPQ